MGRGERNNERLGFACLLKAWKTLARETWECRTVAQGSGVALLLTRKGLCDAEIHHILLDWVLLKPAGRGPFTVHQSLDNGQQNK